MKLLAISEHYFPRIGGTVNYVHETLCALADLGVETELLVPGPQPLDFSLPDHTPYKVTWINSDFPPKGDPSRAMRYEFCKKVGEIVNERLSSETARPDILHVLFGLYLMETLDIETLRTEGLPSVATVHNVPPMECRQIPQSAPLMARSREKVRLAAVAWKNRARLRSHTYDAYIVPSNQVYGFLKSYVNTKIKVVGHGLTSSLQAQMNSPESRLPNNGPVRILTVGGYAPHKRQHIIPQTAQRLRHLGIDFFWAVAGPSGRVKGYFESIERDVRDRDLSGVLQLNNDVPYSKLGSLYDNANIYVQPSIEEGFCLTALDAAASGLPVIGCPAGALPEIVEASGGLLVASDPTELANAIGEFVNERKWPSAYDNAARVKRAFSWEKAAAALMETYQSVRR